MCNPVDVKTMAQFLDHRRVWRATIARMREYSSYMDIPWSDTYDPTVGNKIVPKYRMCFLAYVALVVGFSEKQVADSGGRIAIRLIEELWSSSSSIKDVHDQTIEKKIHIYNRHIAGIIVAEALVKRFGPNGPRFGPNGPRRRGFYNG